MLALGHWHFSLPQALAFSISDGQARDSVCKASKERVKDKHMNKGELDTPHEEHNRSIERKIEAGDSALQPATTEDVKHSVLLLREDWEQLRLQIRKSANTLIKWQIGIGIVIVLCLAKGFGWLG